MKTEHIAHAARELVGIPFGHAGRNGYALDCGGLAYLSARMCGLLADYVPPNYNEAGTADALESFVSDTCYKVEKEDLRHGDILVFCINNNPAHLAIFCGDTIIHSHRGLGKVTEERISPGWQKRVHAYYRFKELK